MMTEPGVNDLFTEIMEHLTPANSPRELQEMLDRNPAEFFDAVCLQAVDEKVADIFWKTNSPPCFRISSRIVQLDIEPLTKKQMEAIFLYHVMNEEQRERFKKRPDLDTALEIPDVIRFRVNIYSQRGGLASVMRLIPLDIPTLEELNLPRALVGLASQKSGLCLVTGPTGSGKSTTLAAMIDLINSNRRCNIITVEDPIEFSHKDKLSIVSQREVGLDTNCFADALRAALRQAPDVILVGEMRDLETMSIGMTAAETGHMVFSTLHTNSAAETIERIINMYPPHEKPQISLRLSTVLCGVLCQKLLPTKDKRKRVCGIEVMINTPTISKLIEEGKAGNVLQAINEGEYWGMQSMNKSILGHFTNDLITEQTAIQYAGNATEMRQSIRRLGQQSVKTSASTT